LLNVREETKMNTTEIANRLAKRAHNMNHSYSNWADRMWKQLSSAFERNYGDQDFSYSSSYERLLRLCPELTFVKPSNHREVMTAFWEAVLEIDPEYSDH